MRKAAVRAAAALAVVGMTFSLGLVEAGATSDVSAAAPGGEVSVQSDPVSCWWSDDYFKIRYDVTGWGDYETMCWANSGWVNNGNPYERTISMCAGNNDVDYDVGNIRTTLWRGTCRSFNERTYIGRIWIR